MKKRLIAGIVTSLFACCMLAGCNNSNTGNEIVSESESLTESESVVESESEGDSMEGKTTLTYIGHSAVKIVSKAGQVIYIDPQYTNYDYSDDADFILVTHGHDDHKPYYKLKLKEGGIKATNAEALHDGIYESLETDGIKIEAVPAGGNDNHDVKYCVGYIVTVDGIQIYHAGDTSKLDTMGELASRNIDYAFYPIDGVYNMDAVEATEVANLVGAKYNIPFHEMDNHDVDPDAQRKSDNFNPEGRLIMEYGETIVIGE